MDKVMNQSTNIELDSIRQRIPKQDLVLLCRDFIAQIDKKKIFRSVIGKYILHEHSNDNGKTLVECATQQICL